MLILPHSAVVLPVVAVVASRVGVAIPAQLPGWGGGTFNAAPADGIGQMVAAFSQMLGASLANALVLFVTLVALRLLLRSTLAAVALPFAVVILISWNVTPNPELAVPLAFILNGLAFWLLFRFGVLFFVVANALPMLLLRFPLTFDFDAWYFGNTVFIVSIIGGLATYGFYTSLAGRSVFGDEDEQATLT